MPVYEFIHAVCLMLSAVSIFYLIVVRKPNA